MKLADQVNSHPFKGLSLEHVSCMKVLHTQTISLHLESQSHGLGSISPWSLVLWLSLLLLLLLNTGLKFPLTTALVRDAGFPAAEPPWT